MSEAVDPKKAQSFEQSVLALNFGTAYAANFAQTFSEIAKENNAELIPFLLEGVGGHAELNQPDMIHPTAAGQQLVADLVWRSLEPILRKE